MENIIKFVIDAMKGGFFVENLRINGGYMAENSLSSRGDMSTTDVLLSPDAWRCVGKTRGWFPLACNACRREAVLDGHYYRCEEDGLLVDGLYADMQWKLERDIFLNSLDEGLTLDEALSKITNDTR